MSKAYIYTILTLIKHRRWIKVTICNIFPASLTVAKLVKHRSNTPKQTSMWVICKESSILDIDVNSWTWCAHWETNNLSLGWFTWSWTKENFCFCLKSYNASIFNHQYSVISYQIYLHLPCKNQQSITITPPQTKAFPFSHQAWRLTLINNGLYIVVIYSSYVFVFVSVFSVLQSFI